MLTTNSDHLKNLSVFNGACRVCGEVQRSEVEQEIEVIWVSCKCGHVFPLTNKTKWN